MSGPAPAAAAPEDLPTAVEDFAYPDAAAILAERGIELVSGDGHFVLADCPATKPGGVVWISSYEAGAGADFCFQIQGPAGYLALEIPQTYNVRGDGVHDLTATVRTDDQTETVAIDRDRWTPVGEENPRGGTLLELAATKGLYEGDSLPPANPQFPYLARVNVGLPGRPGSKACTGSLVASSWVLTAASCFGEDTGELATGAPAQPTTVSFGGRTPLGVAWMIPHEDRNLALVRVVTPLHGVTPAKKATAASTNGQALQALGYGRTATEWVPGTAHTAATTVTELAAGTGALALPQGGICKGDAGGPVLNSSGEIVGLIDTAGQQGCLGTAQGTADASMARLDDTDWIDATIRTDAKDIPWGWNWHGWNDAGRIADADYDGDGRTDRALVNPDGRWFITTSSGSGSPFAWGEQWYGWDNAGRIAVGDYDGDGKADPTLVTPTGAWYVKASSGTSPIPWGWQWHGWNNAGRIPVADYDGDGKTDRTLVNPDGKWFILPSSGAGAPFAFGEQWYGWDNNGRIAVADYDGDGKADPTLVTPIGTWYVKASGGLSTSPIPWGWQWHGWNNAGRIAVADYDGDAKADRALVNPDGSWFVIGSKGGYPIPWGEQWYGWNNAGRLLVSDFGGDGKADRVLVNPDGKWFVVYSSP